MNLIALIIAIGTLLITQATVMAEPDQSADSLSRLKLQSSKIDSEKDIAIAAGNTTDVFRLQTLGDLLNIRISILESHDDGDPTLTILSAQAEYLEKHLNRSEQEVNNANKAILSKFYTFTTNMIVELQNE